MATDKDTLLSMGFDAARVDWALKSTGNRGLQPAMDHILENESKPVPDLGGVSETKTSAGAGAGEDAMDVDDDDEDAQALKSLGKAVAEGVEAKSIKCTTCSKLFANTALANFHATKSSHTSFEESTETITPLTDAEKKERLEELRAKMVEKRARKAKEDEEARKVNEGIRRKTGKDVGKMKEEMEKREAIKDAEVRRRDKIEDAKAKAAIKAQIEADKKTRAEKFAREKAIRDGLPIPTSSGPSSSGAAGTPTTPASAAGVPGREYQSTRLQIRMASGGQPYTTSLDSDSPLRAVAEYLAGQLLAVEVDTVVLAQQFPRKTFTQEDMAKSLRTLGLTPSAVLIATVP